MIKIYDPTDFTYTAGLFEVVDGKLRLGFIDRPLQTYERLFTSSVGFTFENDLVEFVANRLQQKDVREANATFGASYTSNINGNWGNGVLTGAGVGGPTVVGGKLDLTGATKMVQYQALNNADSLQVGCVRFKYTPNYSGAPATTRGLFCISESAASINNMIYLSHSSVGNIAILSRDSVGGSINNGIFGTFVAVAGVEVEMELNWDYTTGATRFFINGLQIGSTFVQTGTRSGTVGIFNLGAYYAGTVKADGYFNDLKIFSVVKHTENYTPGYTVTETIFLESKTVCPALTLVSPGNIQSVQTVDAVISSDTHATIGVTGMQFWYNGATWVASNETYAQSNTLADIVLYLPILSAMISYLSGPYIIMVYFGASNTQMYVESVEMIYTDQIYNTANPYFETTESIVNHGLIDFDTTEILNNGNLFKYALKKGSNWYYWNGTAWALSNSTYAQASLPADITANIETFNPDTGTSSLVRCFVHSDDGLSTPEFSELEVEYSYWGGNATAPSTCTVFGYCFDINGEPEAGKTITCIMTTPQEIYDDKLILNKILTTITDTNGTWDFNLVRSTLTGAKYKIIFSDQIFMKTYEITVPDAEYAEFVDLI